MQLKKVSKVCWILSGTKAVQPAYIPQELFILVVSVMSVNAENALSGIDSVVSMQ